MKLSGLRDKHLNVFINYADNRNEYLENNITKAFINTLDSLTKEARKDVFKNLFGIDLPDDFSCKFYLQWRSSNEEIKQKITAVKDENRYLLAFSPTGEHWDFDGTDTKNIEKIKESIKSHYRKKNPPLSEKEIKERTDYHIHEIEKIEKGISIPDALILISDSAGTPLYAIAMENKKYDLDPYQLNNHLEKSLGLLSEGKEKKIIYRKYKEIINSIKNFAGNYTVDNFIEYMIILGYYESDNFKECFLADSELRKRVSFHFGKDILEKVKKELKDEGKPVKTVDQRNNNIWRLHADFKDRLQEINLCFDEEKFNGFVVLSLVFASTSGIARNLYETINPEKFKELPAELQAEKSFHLLYRRGRNIGKSYIEDKEEKEPKKSLYEYVKYWKANRESIKTTTGNNPKSIISIYKKLEDDGFITHEKYESMATYFDNIKNDVSVVPEIILEPRWKYEEIAEMGIDGFAEEIKKKVYEALALFE